MTGHLDATKSCEHLQASADAFSEQLALRVAALVREAAAGHAALLRRQLLEGKDMASCENSAWHHELDVAGDVLLDGNLKASGLSATDVTCNNAATSTLRYAVDTVAQGGVDADGSACAQPHQEFPDVPRLQHIELPIETPRVPNEVAEQLSPLEGPSCVGNDVSGTSDETHASFAGKNATPSLTPSLSAASVGDASQYSDENMKELIQERFQELDCRRAGHLNAANLRSCVQNLHSEEGEALDSKITEAIEAFNKINTRFRPMSNHLHELTFEGFFHIMVADNFDKDLSTEDAATLTDIRTVCVNEAALKLIATKAMVSTKDITGERHRRAFYNRLMEPISSFVICVNALCIGIQLDMAAGWAGWQVLEVFFTCFFIFELAIKLRYSGFIDMYFGDDLRWNLFDTLIVLLATVDMVFWIGNLLGMDSSISLRNISIMRLARLMRITRIVRLLKLHFFKDLTIMINGVFGGLKTLFWAFVLLLFIVYIVGVMLRQVIVMADSDCATSTCLASKEHLMTFEPQLFSNVFRSMFTVWRCLTDGCSSADGTPLILYFWDAHGPLFVLAYVFVVVFILFGVFNLIMAIFVEKTLEYAKLDTAKRREARYKEEVRIAKELRSLVLKICSYQEGENPKLRKKTTGQQNMETIMSGFRSATGGANGLNNVEEDDVLHPSSLTISRAHFDSVINQENIRSRMEDLEISVMSGAKLFDILDANGSGVVDVVELTEGLMSLRGPADKGDIISGSLLVKSTQKMVKDMQEDLMKCTQNQKRQLELLRQMDAKFKAHMLSENQRQPMSVRV